MSIYHFEVNTIGGQKQSLSSYKGKVLLIVNTASKCGFTPQYKGLQALYDEYKENGFEVLGFPSNQFAKQEPAENEEIAQFCERNYGVTFPLFAKIDVKGSSAHPLFEYLSEHAPGILGLKSIKWNFTKFLIDKNGEIVKRYGSNVKPEKIEQDIKNLLKK